jgi:phosphopantetheine binding protein
MRRNVSCWRQDIGTDASFFDVGGNSLLLVQVNIELNAVFPDLTITDLFTYTNIVSLAAFINRENEKTAVNEKQWAIRLADGYVNKSLPIGEAETQQADLYVKLSREVESGLRAVAAANQVGLLDIAAAAWAYALTTCSHAKEVPLHLGEGPDTIKRLVIPVPKAETREQLYLLTAGQRAAPQQVLSAGNLVRLQNGTDEPYESDEVWPLIRQFHPGVPPSIGQLFDIVLTIFDRSDNLAFSLQHGRRFYNEKMEELLQTFVNILEHAI